MSVSFSFSWKHKHKFVDVLGGLKAYSSCVQLTHYTVCTYTMHYVLNLNRVYGNKVIS